jgi:hypothetical protein
MSVTTIKLTAASSISIDDNDGVMALSVQAEATGGSFDFIGSRPFKTFVPSTLTLTAGEGVNLTATNPQVPISGVTITWVSGTVNVLISYT